MLHLLLFSLLRLLLPLLLPFHFSITRIAIFEKESLRTAITSPRGPKVAPAPASPARLSSAKLPSSLDSLRLPLLLLLLPSASRASQEGAQCIYAAGVLPLLFSRGSLLGDTL